MKFINVILYLKLKWTVILCNSIPYFSHAAWFEFRLLPAKMAVMFSFSIDQILHENFVVVLSVKSLKSYKTQN